MIKSVFIDGYKGQTKRNIQLGRLSLLTGRNGSGKTAVYEAVHIAIKGKHPTGGDTLQSIKPYCGDGMATFEVSSTDISVAREITFGSKTGNKADEKTVHTVYINGSEAKIKEAQGIIDEVYTDSMMRLDIGKFSKMNDIDRAIILSDLLGSAKVNASEVVLDILDLFYRKDPASDYVIKYRLNQTSENYDKKALIAAMREQYAEKSDVIIEMLDTCEAIMNEKTGLVELSDYLDSAYEAVKKYRNAKAQEKQFTQNAQSELAVDSMDPKDVARGIEEVTEKYNQVDAQISELQTFLDSLAAIKPSTPLAKIEADIKEYDKKIAQNKALIENASANITNITAEKDAVSLSLSEWQTYNAWVEKKNIYEDTIGKQTTAITEYEKSLQKESDKSLMSLEAARTAYLSLKAINPGECPTCGTVISDETASARKKDIQEAKQKYDDALKEIKLRRDNTMVEAKIQMAKKQLADAQNDLKKLQDNPVNKPDTDAKALTDKRQALTEAYAKSHKSVKTLNTENNTLASSLAYAVAEKDKHAKYAAKIREKSAFIELYGADVANPAPVLEQVINDKKKLRHEYSERLTEYRVAEQMNNTIAEGQKRVFDLQVAYDTLDAVSEIIRKYKNAAVQRKIEPVQMLAKKYYSNATDEIVVTPKTIGINRDGVYIQQAAMSAGESLSLMSAVLIAIMESSGVKPNYLFVDAAEIDVNNMSILLDALEKSRLDTVIVAHHMPAKSPDEWVKEKHEGMAIKASKEWTLINMEG